MHVRNRRDPFHRARSGGLARASDRVEASALVLLLAAGLGMIGAAFCLGGVVAADTGQRERNWLETSYATSAVTTGIGVVVPDSAAQVALAPARWADPAGRQHTGNVELAWAPVPGTSLAVRVGADGTTRVGDVATPTTVGLIIGIWTLFAGWVVIGLLWLAVERLVQRYNCRRWADAWVRVEPIWSGRQQDPDPGTIRSS